MRFIGSFVSIRTMVPFTLATSPPFGDFFGNVVYSPAKTVGDNPSPPGGAADFRPKSGDDGAPPFGTISNLTGCGF
jgi:hypothetical protein